MEFAVHPTQSCFGQEAKKGLKVKEEEAASPQLLPCCDFLEYALLRAQLSLGWYAILCRVGQGVEAAVLQEWRHGQNKMKVGRA